MQPYVAKRHLSPGGTIPIELMMLMTMMLLLVMVIMMMLLMMMMMMMTNTTMNKGMVKGMQLKKTSPGGRILTVLRTEKT